MIELLVFSQSLLKKLSFYKIDSTGKVTVVSILADTPCCANIALTEPFQ